MRGLELPVITPGVAMVPEIVIPRVLSLPGTLHVLAALTVMLPFVAEDEKLIVTEFVP